MATDNKELQITRKPHASQWWLLVAIVLKLSPGPVREGAFFEKRSADFREFAKIHENSRFFKFGGSTPLFDHYDSYRHTYATSGDLSLF